MRPATPSRRHRSARWNRPTVGALPAGDLDVVVRAGRRLRPRGAPHRLRRRLLRPVPAARRPRRARGGRLRPAGRRRRAARGAVRSARRRDRDRHETIRCDRGGGAGRRVHRAPAADHRGATPSSRRSTSRRPVSSPRPTRSCPSASSRCATGRIIVADAVHQLVRPDVPPSPRSQTVHLMRPQDLADAPPIEEVRGRPPRRARPALRTCLVRRGRDGLPAADVRWFPAPGGTRGRSTSATWPSRSTGSPGRCAPSSATACRASHERYGVPVASPHEALRRRARDGAALPRAGRQAPGSAPPHRAGPAASRTALTCAA